MSSVEVLAETASNKWLHGMPSDWQTINGRRLFGLRNIKALPNDAELTASQKYGVIPKEDFMALEGRRVVEVIKDSSILKHVEVGDFVISMRSFQGGIEFSDYRGCVSSAYVVLKPIAEVCTKYFRYLFKSSSYINALQSTSNLIRDGQALRYENFVKIQLPQPPLAEQQLIAEFLDEETRQIDALMEKQQELLLVLQERRRALVTSEITGADASAEWRESRLKYVAKIFASNVDKKSEDGQISVQLCNYVDVYYNDVITQNLEFMNATATAEQVSKFSLKKDWVIVTKDSESADDIGISALVGEDIPNVLCGYHLSVIQPHKNMNGRFLKYFFDSSDTKRELARRAKGLTRVGLGADAFGTLPIRIPPLDVQEKIAEGLRVQLEQIDELFNRATRLIELLTERRQNLISLLVTGQVRLSGNGVGQ